MRISIRVIVGAVLAAALAVAGVALHYGTAGSASASAKNLIIIHSSEG